MDFDHRLGCRRDCVDLFADGDHAIFAVFALAPHGNVFIHGPFEGQDLLGQRLQLRQQGFGNRVVPRGHRALKGLVDPAEFLDHFRGLVGCAVNQAGR